MDDVMAARSIEPWTTIDDVEIHPVAVAEVRSDLDRITHDRIREPAEVLQLADNDVLLPPSLRLAIRKLPLAAPAHLRVWTWWLAPLG